MVTQTRASLPILIVLSAVVFIVGCHRGFYRRQANAEAMRLVSEKNADPRWDSSTGEIELDPQSRMFNPFSEDHPPMPPDDQVSHQYMHKVDCKPGYPQWHSNGDTNYTENPEWLAYLPVNEKGEVVINLERAVDLAFLHSTTFQAQKEELFLSALDVSIERFDFDGQLTTGFNSFFNTQGRLAPGGSQSTLTNQRGVNGGGINWQKLGVTGTNFAVGIANTLLWNFAGPDTTSANTLIDFSVIQPLLRNAGRTRILESLTQAERTLLANVRQLDRFRRGFYLQVTIGRSPGQGVSRGGNFLGLPQGAQGGGGLIGLLQQRQFIRNQEFTVRQLENVLNQFREFFARDRIDALQKSQVESQLYGEQANLLSLRRGYQDSLDIFKQTLGIPPHIPIVIEDPILDQFALIADNINDRQVQLNFLRDDVGSALILLGLLLPENVPLTADELNALDADRRTELLEKLNAEGKQGFASNDQLEQRVQDILPFVDQALETINQIESVDEPQIIDDFEKLERARPERVEYLKKLRAIVESKQLGELGEIDLALMDPDSIVSSIDVTRDGRVVTGTQTRFDAAVKRINEVKAALETTRNLIIGFPESRPTFSDQELWNFLKDNLLLEIPRQLTSLYNGILELSLVQAQARSNAISLYDVDLNDVEALGIARCMRLDWMNARASLVDSWREIEFVADQLESQLDLVFEGSIGNFGDNPLSLRTENGTLRAGLRFDSPTVRQLERNAYRETLIRYQQARRNYYRFEDEVNRNLRASLRNLNLNKILFELNRRSVQVQIEQLEQARLKLDEPSPIQQGGGAGGFSNTVAQDLLAAISSLQSTQNAYLNGWVSYEVARRNLDFDLGTMQLDETGRWIDPGVIDESIGHRVSAMLGLDTTCLDCELGGSSAGMPNSMEIAPGNPAIPGNVPPSVIEQPPLEPRGSEIPSGFDNGSVPQPGDLSMPTIRPLDGVQLGPRRRVFGGGGIRESRGMRERGNSLRRRSPFNSTAMENGNLLRR